MSRIKIGQIGICHEHAAGKLQALRLLPDVFEIVGVVDDRATTAARFAGDDLTPYQGLTWLTEDELFATPGLQAVLVETPNEDLVPTALRCMEHNLAIHMDKPGGEDPALFKRLREGCEARRLPFQMGYMFRSNPAMQWCKEAVREGWLGDIFDVEASMSHNYGGQAYQAYIGHFAGGIMYNLGCHFIDLVVAMLGRPRRISPFLRAAPGSPDAIKNQCLTVLEYPHTTVTLRSCSLEVEGLANRRFKVCGTLGTLELCPLERFDGQPLTMRLSLLKDAAYVAAGTRTLSFGPTQDRYKAQLIELAGMIRGKTPNLYPAEHDILVQDVVLAASGYTNWNPGD